MPEPTKEEIAKACVEDYARERKGDPETDLIGKMAERIADLEARVTLLEKPV